MIRPLRGPATGRPIRQDGGTRGGAGHFILAVPGVPAMRNTGHDDA